MDFSIYRHLVGLLVWGISPTQSLKIRAVNILQPLIEQLFDKDLLVAAIVCKYGHIL
jgi:hypothetical protein